MPCRDTNAAAIRLITARQEVGLPRRAAPTRRNPGGGRRGGARQGGGGDGGDAAGDAGGGGGGRGSRRAPGAALRAAAAEVLPPALPPALPLQLLCSRAAVTEFASGEGSQVAGWWSLRAGVAHWRGAWTRRAGGALTPPVKPVTMRR